MATDDMRYYETFYGIHTNHWTGSFGAFTNHNKILVKEYISDATSTEDTSPASDVNEFLYAHHIKKIYHIEGVITGHITLAATNVTCAITSFRVTLCKMHDDLTPTELFSTGWKTVDDTLTYEDEIGEERVYYFEIDAWEKETLTEFERLYVKVEVTADADTVLMNSNDADWEDVKITIPFML